MKILIDMNLSPAWVLVFEEAGHTASHWSTIGMLNAPDREVFSWAKANGYVLFTHDLDFGAILAATEAEGPSVIQIRAHRVDFEKFIWEKEASEFRRIKLREFYIHPLSTVFKVSHFHTGSPVIDGQALFC